MIEMDRLVMTLSGEESQTLTIESKNSHATMKNNGGSLEKYVLNQSKSLDVGRYKYVIFTLHEVKLYFDTCFVTT